MDPVVTTLESSLSLGRYDKTGQLPAIQEQSSLVICHTQALHFQRSTSVPDSLLAPNVSRAVAKRSESLVPKSPTAYLELLPWLYTFPPELRV